MTNPPTLPKRDETPLPSEPATIYYCAWFARCTNESTHYEWHPVLGWVPACDRCVKIGR